MLTHSLLSLFPGIGYAMVAVSVILAYYQSVFISWMFYYLFGSMLSVLPWLHCNSDWATSGMY